MWKCEYFVKMNDVKNHIIISEIKKTQNIHEKAYQS